MIDRIDVKNNQPTAKCVRFAWNLIVSRYNSRTTSAKISLNSIYFLAQQKKKQMYVDCSPYWYELRTFCLSKNKIAGQFHYRCSLIARSIDWFAFCTIFRYQACDRPIFNQNRPNRSCLRHLYFALCCIALHCNGNNLMSTLSTQNMNASRYEGHKNRQSLNSRPTNCLHKRNDKCIVCIWICDKKK